MGMDLKRAQYKEGEAFVNAVVAQRGLDLLNRVWERPANLPTPARNPRAGSLGAPLGNAALSRGVGAGGDARAPSRRRLGSSAFPTVLKGPRTATRKRSCCSSWSAVRKGCRAEKPKRRGKRF